MALAGPRGQTPSGPLAGSPRPGACAQPARRSPSPPPASSPASRSTTTRRRAETSSRGRASPERHFSGPASSAGQRCPRPAAARTADDLHPMIVACVRPRVRAGGLPCARSSSRRCRPPPAARGPRDGGSPARASPRRPWGACWRQVGNGRNLPSSVSKLRGAYSGLQDVFVEQRRRACRVDSWRAPCPPGEQARPAFPLTEGTRKLRSA
jgi:hypothetical protein